MNDKYWVYHYGRRIAWQLSRPNTQIIIILGRSSSHRSWYDCRVLCIAGGDAAAKKKRKKRKKNKGAPVKQQTDPPSIPIVEMFPKSKARSVG